MLPIKTFKKTKSQHWILFVLTNYAYKMEAVSGDFLFEKSHPAEILCKEDVRERSCYHYVR